MSGFLSFRLSPLQLSTWFILRSSLGESAHISPMPSSQLPDSSQRGSTEISTKIPSWHFLFRSAAQWRTSTQFPRHYFCAKIPFKHRSVFFLSSSLLPRHSFALQCTLVSRRQTLYTYQARTSLYRNAPRNPATRMSRPFSTQKPTYFATFVPALAFGQFPKEFGTLHGQHSLILTVLYSRWSHTTSCKLIGAILSFQHLCWWWHQSHLTILSGVLLFCELLSIPLKLDSTMVFPRSLSIASLYWRVKVVLSSYSISTKYQNHQIVRLSE
jgi:hypothetical protein